MVDKSSSITILKKLKKIKTLWNCLDMCENNNQCHYTEYHIDSQDCYLYDKKAYFHIIPSNESMQIDLYKRQIYSYKEFHGILLMNNHFMKVENTTDSDSCWEECLKEEKCYMVSFNINTNDCVLLEVTTGSIKFIDHTDYTSLTYENVEKEQFRNWIDSI